MGAGLLFLVSCNFCLNNFELLVEFASSGTHAVVLTKLEWSQATLGKFWKIILNTNKV